MGTDVTLNDNAANLGAVAKYFGGSLTAFRQEWAQLTPEDKIQLRNGIGDGTLTY